LSHPGGGVRAWRYQGSSRARLFSRISPCTGPWGYRHGGWRLAGRGNEFPLPCLSRSNHLASRRHPHPARTFLPVKHTLLLATPTPPAPAARDTHTLLPASPPRPRLRRSSPAPSWGRGPCVAISGEQPCPALLQDLPMHWTVGISPRGVGLTGRGNLFPLPCLSRSNHLASRCRHFSEGYPDTSSATPTPPAPS